jgi:hypothetical protein
MLRSFATFSIASRSSVASTVPSHMALWACRYTSQYDGGSGCGLVDCIAMPPKPCAGRRAPAANRNLHSGVRPHCAGRRRDDNWSRGGLFLASAMCGICGGNFRAACGWRQYRLHTYHATANTLMAASVIRSVIRCPAVRSSIGQTLPSFAVVERGAGNSSASHVPGRAGSAPCR